MYQRILVPVDGSATSSLALHEALKLAKGGAGVRLVHVIEEIYPLDAEGYAFVDYAALQQAARAGGQRLLEREQGVARAAGIEAETALLESGGLRAAAAIDAEARNWSADLIVIGTHGRAGFSRLLFGSVAEGVVRGATVPVLLVRGAESEDGAG